MLIKDLNYQPRSCTDDIKSRLNLSDDESQIFDLAIRDKTITEISLILKMSTSTVSRRLDDIRYKVKVLRNYNANKKLDIF